MAYIKVNCDGEIVTLTEACRRKNISFNAVWCHKRSHPELNYEEIIEFYVNKVPRNAKYRKRLNSIWYSMKDRCYNVKHDYYYNYGGRGIKVCDRWLIFDNFYKDLVNGYKNHVKEYGEKNTTLDRIDVNGDYCKENCKWSTKKEQANNRKDNVITPTGETLKQYCDRNNLPYLTICSRLQIGWTLERALTEPIKHQKPRLKLTSGQTIKEACKEHNINYVTFKDRLKEGMTIEEALNTPVKEKIKYTLPTGESLYKYCNRNNIQYATIQARLKAGKPLEEALKNPTYKQRKDKTNEST